MFSSTGIQNSMHLTACLHHDLKLFSPALHHWSYSQQHHTAELRIETSANWVQSTGERHQATQRNLSTARVSGWTTLTSVCKGNNSYGVTDRTILQQGKEGKKLFCNKPTLASFPALHSPHVATRQPVVPQSSISSPSSSSAFYTRMVRKTEKSSDLSYKFSYNFTLERLPYVS